MDVGMLHFGGGSLGGEGKGGTPGDCQVSGLSRGLHRVDISGEGEE